MGVAHLLNRSLEVWRPQTADDGSGGQTITLTQVGEVRAMVSQPSVQERLVVAQSGAAHSHNVYALPDADVSRGDELRGDGQVFRVIAEVEPSRPVYLKAFCELIQTEGT